MTEYRTDSDYCTLKPNTLLQCKDTHPTYNAWCRCRGSDAGAGSCRVLFLKYEFSYPPYHDVWGVIMWMSGPVKTAPNPHTHYVGRVDKITPRALEGCFAEVRQ